MAYIWIISYCNKHALRIDREHCNKGRNKHTQPVSRKTWRLVLKRKVKYKHVGTKDNVAGIGTKIMRTSWTSNASPRFYAMTA